ncbi:hypothetical protein Tco_0353551 [Tanacetum coccineum]
MCSNAGEKAFIQVNLELPQFAPRTFHTCDTKYLQEESILRLNIIGDSIEDEEQLRGHHEKVKEIVKLELTPNELLKSDEVSFPNDAGTMTGKLGYSPESWRKKHNRYRKSKTLGAQDFLSSKIMMESSTEGNDIYFWSVQDWKIVHDIVCMNPCGVLHTEFEMASPRSNSSCMYRAKRGDMVKETKHGPRDGLLVLGMAMAWSLVKDVKEMNDVFVSVENDLDETFKKMELLKDRLLEASLAEDIKNLVITTCVEIRNKDLHDEINRISKELKDVSNESKTADTVCNDAFEVTQGLSKRILELEKDLSKFEAKSIAFEIALQHKSRENNYLKTMQKENDNFMASLQLEKAHLKQTYIESVQRSKVETNQCDEVKVKDNFDEIETKNIELEYRVASLIKENEHLKLTYKNLFDSIKKSRVQTKTSNVTQDEAENLKSQLFEFAETKFKNILRKIEFFKKKQLDISDLNKGSGENVCDNAKCELQTKIVELEKVLTQQTKDFNDVKLELSNRTAKFEAYFEKLEKTKVVLERQLARKVDDS